MSRAVATENDFQIASYFLSRYSFKNNMSSKAAVFRAIAEARRSSRRFQANRVIPDETLRDILETTMVRHMCENMGVM